MAGHAQNLSDFARLNDGVWLFDPPHPPQHLIILCSWMGAAPRHIAKYTARYQALLRDARILVIQSNVEDVIWRSHATQYRRMAPARQAIKAAEDAALAIRMHIFSNGGVLSATQLIAQYRSDTARTIPLKTLVVDSAPGKPRFDAAISALSQLAPKSGIRRVLGIICAYVGFGLLWLYIRLFRKEFMVARIRRLLNNPAFFDQRVPRTYIYSRTDKLIHWTEVKEHADDAKRVGYDTREEFFESSSHVAHALQDPARYWSIVERTLQPEWA